VAELSQAKGQDDPRNSSDRFSQLYLRPGAAVTDSDRMRNRLFALLESLNYPSDLYKMLRLRTGISVSNYEIFFLKAEIRDVLDAITVVFEEYVAGARGGGYGSNKPQQWLTGVAEIFAEEHVAYEVNRKGAVRFKIDEEFNRGHVTTIAALEGPRYRNAAKSF
jgi:hypothetical protein